VSRKVLTLIHGEEIEVASGQKILSADTYQSLLTAKEMLDKVREDAKKFIEQNVVEAEKIKEQAEKEGFAKGMEQWAEQIEKLEQQIENTLSEMQQLVIPVALKAAKKIVAKELELHPEIIIETVANNLKAVAQHTKIKIFVNKEDFEMLESHKNELKALFESLKSLSIIPTEDVDKGGYIIETEVGIINGQLGNRWALLEKAFEKLIPVPDVVTPSTKKRAKKDQDDKEKEPS
jgi:type III secretion protein L